MPHPCGSQVDVATFMCQYLGMTEEDLKAAVKAYNDAVEAARQTRDQAIAQAAREHMRPSVIERATEYSREHVRRILRAQGIEGRR